MLLGGEEPDLARVQTTVPLTTVVAVAIAMLVALLIVIDVSCYFINACGLTMCVCVHLCGHQTDSTSTKTTSDKGVDDPERYDPQTILACKKTVKFSHTHYRTLGPELIPVYRQSARRKLLSHPRE